jgi:ABC-type glycerol-3-phosphate transport system substrate-binding protein
VSSVEQISAWLGAPPGRMISPLLSRDCVASSRPGIGNNGAPRAAIRLHDISRRAKVITQRTRRDFLRTTAIATGAALAAPYVKSAHSAGKVSVALWDHWVPGANETTLRVVEDWSRANNVEVVVDFLESETANANLFPTLEAEVRARSGHDLVWLWDLDMTVFNESLEPVDGLVHALESEYGPFPDNAAYLARYDGTWRAVAAPSGSSSYPMVSRLDLWKQHAGIDLRTMFPAGTRHSDQVDDWTYQAFLEGCKKLHAAGFPYGNPIGDGSDSAMWLAPLLAFGSQLMTADGDIAVNSDGTRAGLEFLKQLTEYMPRDIYEWDNTANNRWIIEGKGSAIQNPPSAWAVAKEETPDTAAQLWHHDVPAGPSGRYRGAQPVFFGIWSFASNKPAARDLLLHLCQRDQVSEIVRGSQGFDVPLQAAFSDNEVWQKAGPPTGTLYNYPVHGDEVQVVPGYPAPPSIAGKIAEANLIANFVAKVTRDGQSIGDAIVWAEGELDRITKA